MTPDQGTVAAAVKALSRQTDLRGIDEATTRLLRSKVSQDEAGLSIEAIAQLTLDRDLNSRANRTARSEAVIGPAPPTESQRSITRTSRLGTITTNQRKRQR